MILDDLANCARKRVARATEEVSREALAERAKALPKGMRTFEEALRTPKLSFICEIKKASPSKGIISEDFPYLDIARAYDTADADCISVLTEPKWFLGSDAIFKDIRANTTRPMIRKDFTVDAYQIYEAKLLGADAVLLICALLDTPTIAAYLQICSDLGLSALIEAHNENEISQAISAGASLVGVNNRNLKDFSVDISVAQRLRDEVPPDILFVAESGIMSLEDVAAAAHFGADAVLVGEFLMRAQNPADLLMHMRQAAQICTETARSGAMW